MIRTSRQGNICKELPVFVGMPLLNMWPMGNCGTECGHLGEEGGLCGICIEASIDAHQAGRPCLRSHSSSPNWKWRSTRWLSLGPCLFSQIIVGVTVVTEKEGGRGESIKENSKQSPNYNKIQKVHSYFKCSCNEKWRHKKRESWKTKLKTQTQFREHMCISFHANFKKNWCCSWKLSMQIQRSERPPRTNFYRVKMVQNWKYNNKNANTKANLNVGR